MAGHNGAITRHNGVITEDAIREVLRSWFAMHAAENRLSMGGENTKDGYLFYSMDTKKAFDSFIMGYMAGRADALNEGEGND